MTLVNLWSQNKAISYVGHLMQLYFLVSLVTLENFILAIKHMTICHALHYVTPMSLGLCILLLSFCWVISS